MTRNRKSCAFNIRGMYVCVCFVIYVLTGGKSDIEKWEDIDESNHWKNQMMVFIID